MILITLNGGYMGSMKLVVIRQIRIGLGSDNPNKDQTYLFSMVTKLSCVICNCTIQSSPQLKLHKFVVDCGAQVQIWHSVA